MSWFDVVKLKGRDRPLREMQEQHEQEQKEKKKHINRIKFYVGEISKSIYFDSPPISDIFGEIDEYDYYVEKGEYQPRDSNLYYLVDAYVRLYSKKGRFDVDDRNRIYKKYIKNTLPNLSHLQVKYVLENQDKMDLRYIKKLSNALKNWWLPMYEEVVKKNKRKYETEEIENFKRIYQKMIVEPVLAS